MICGKDLGAEYTLKCTGDSVEWYCPEHADGRTADDARATMARLEAAVNNLHMTLHVIYGNNPGAAGFSREFRTLDDGMGGMTTDARTGKTTVHSRPNTRQQRWVTPWENV